MALDSESRKQNEAIKIGAEFVRTHRLFQRRTFAIGVGRTPCYFRLKEAQGHVGGGQTTGDLGQAQWVGLMKRLDRASRSGGASG
jgi:hypothetical protein